ncbi:MAG TPA: hypothetical protein VKY33_07025, partial [Flavobacterium sp.]|nr:hypothetical protein [Flavobacterium sp.]
MTERIEKLIKEAEAFVTESKEDLEAYRIKFLSKKGILNELFAEFKNVPNEQKKMYGQAINTLKTTVEEKIKSTQDYLEEKTSVSNLLDDLTRPGFPTKIGSRHPISLVKNQVIDIFSNIGFNVSEGPEIEDDWHNFEALNFPEHHPARDMQDTFFVEMNPQHLLRTH